MHSTVLEWLARPLDTTLNGKAYEKNEKNTQEGRSDSDSNHNPKFKAKDNCFLM